MLVKALYLLSAKYIEFKPDLMITPNYVSLQHVILDLYLRQKNIKTISISSLGLKKLEYLQILTMMKNVILLSNLIN